MKFDGWRAQLHKDGEEAKVYGRDGKDLSRRFANIRVGLASLPCRSTVMDAEVVVCAKDGRPDFAALMAGDKEGLCAWCFDLMELDGRDLRPLPLIERKALLRELLIEADDDTLRYSEEFPEPVHLLEVAEKLGLEGSSRRRPPSPISPDAISRG